MEPNTNLHPGNRPSSAVSRYLTFSPLPRLSLPVGFYLFRRSENNAGNRVRRYEALLSSTFSAMDFEKNIDKGCIVRDVGTCKKTTKKTKRGCKKVWNGLRFKQGQSQSYPNSCGYDQSLLWLFIEQHSDVICCFYLFLMVN